jgi:hypothetical protein
LRKVKVLILTIALVSAGCGALKRKTAEDAVVSGAYNAEMFLDEVSDKNLTNESFYINKAEVHASVKGFNQNLILSVKFKRPDSAMFIIKAKIGLEIARALITNDTVIINDRLNKRLIVSGPEYFKRKYGLEPKLINMMFGDFLITPELDKNEINCQRNSSQIDFIKDQNIFLLRFDCDSKKLTEASIESIKERKKLEFFYSEFIKNSEVIYPEVIKIHISNEEMDVSIRIEKIDTNWNGNINFVPNTGYKRRVLR